MRNLHYLFGFLLVTSFILGSCDFKDKGLITLTPLSDIIIDTTGIPLEQQVLAKEALKISPIVKREGYTDDNFTYEWRITLKPGADFSLHEVVSTEKDLNAVLDLIPSSDYYSLWYRVTDKTTGLMAGVVFRVFVQAPSNQGLVVTDSDDGVTSDFSLIQDTLFTYNWVKDDESGPKATLYKRNLYFKANGADFNGIVHSMFAQRLYKDGIYTNYLHGASQHNAFRINTFDYSLTLSGKELFYDPLVTLDIDAYFLNGPSQVWIINNKKIANRLAEDRGAVGVRKFSVPAPGDYSANRFIAVHPTTSGQAIFYDEGLGKFLKMTSYLNINAPPQEVDASTTVFDARNLPGYTVLGGGLGNFTEVRFVLKKDDYFGVYCFTDRGVPRRLIDISTAPDIANAVGFVFPIDQAVIYYATANKVYSIRIPQGGTPTYTDLYTSPDPVTSFEMMRQTGHQPVTYTERVLLLATYNGSEGKVTALPIPEEGLDLGTVDLSRKATFGGFKKISAMAIQE